MSYLREELDPDVTLWATMCHLSSFAGILVPIPFVNILAPLLIWILKKDEHPFIDDNGREVLTIKAAIRARDGYFYEYPMTIRFL